MANLTRATELLGNLRSDGFSVALEGEQLVLSHPRRSPSAGELAGVRQFKSALIELLRAPEPAPAPDSPAPAPMPPEEDWRLRMCTCEQCQREDAEARQEREARRFDRFRGY